MKLMIVESPNKVASIQKYLGDGWQVLASYGHIRDLPDDELGVDVDGDFRLHYVTSERSGSTVARIRKEATHAEKVYLATDPDREGEAIAWHVLDAARIPPAKAVRVTFGSITREAVQAAVASPRQVDMHLVHAQEARRALDRLVGYVISPALSSAAQQKLSAGRVQSPAVRLVVEREAQIRGFTKVDHFGAALEFGGWRATWDTRPHLAEGEEYVLDRGLAEQAAACRKLTVMAAETAPRREAPPAPFSTSTLLQAASVALKLDPAATMDAAQKLFEAGVITYHRSDSVNFDAAATEAIREALAKQNIPVSPTPRKFREKGDAQAGHEAIRPTDITRQSSGLNGQLDALYQLIRIRALASQAADAEYSVTTLRMRADEGFSYAAKGSTLIVPGWRSLLFGDDTHDPDAGDEEAEDGGKVPHLDIGSQIAAKSGKVLAKSTKPPARYTEASIVKKLESLGIGRPSTYAAILRNITDRGYIAVDKRKLVATQLGIDLVKALVKSQCQFIDYSYTRNLEAELDRVAEGALRYAEVVAPAYERINQDATRTRTADLGIVKVTCPECNQGFMRRIKGKCGVFWGCSRSECNNTMDEKDSKPVPRLSHPCPDCGRPMYRRKGEKGHFWGCSGFRDGCKCTLPDDKGKPGQRAAVSSAHSCPKCGKGLIHRKKPAKGKAKGFNFWGCSGYPGCDFVAKDAGGQPEGVG